MRAQKKRDSEPVGRGLQPKIRGLEYKRRVLNLQRRVDCPKFGVKVISKRPTAPFGRFRALREIESLARKPSLEWLRAPRDTLKA